MAAREFHGIINNEFDEAVHWVADDCDGGIWQDPWYPSKTAKQIDPNQKAEWRSESDGILTGTSGWALWVVNNVFSGGGDAPHSEFIRVNWSVPFYGPPTINAGAFHSDPRDAFFNPAAQPLLEIAGISMLTADGRSEPALAQAAEITPYVLGIPVSWWTDDKVTPHVTCEFVVRLRNRVSSPLFGGPGLGKDTVMMESFRFRAQSASQSGFVGAFPNFYEADYGRNHVGGTIFLKPEVAQWQDVNLADLQNPPLDDFGERMRLTNAYASRNGFVGGFPNYFHADYGKGVVCGTVLLKGDSVTWRDVPLSDLGNPSLDDIGARFRATQDYATRNGFVGGFPNLFHADYGRGIVCGTILLKGPAAEWRDVVMYLNPA